MKIWITQTKMSRLWTEGNIHILENNICVDVNIFKFFKFFYNTQVQNFFMNMDIYVL